MAGFGLVGLAVGLVSVGGGTVILMMGTVVRGPVGGAVVGDAVGGPVVGDAVVRRLWGRGLRFVLVDLLRRHEELTVAEMVAAVEQAGYPVEGRLSKVISDSLRWELARGRVTRVRRGVYRYRSAPRATIRRIKLFAASCQAWIVAVTRHQTPPPTPPDTRKPFYWGPDDPTRPPWDNTAWLWTT